jgi:N-acetylneuraminic acid mutarotase
MWAHLRRVVVVMMIAVLTVACGARVQASSPTASLGTSCPSSGPVPTVGCWRAILPPGSGGFPAAPDPQDGPQWKPGLFPLTLEPKLGVSRKLWMTGQTRAYSSPDGLAWTEHVKTDWGERIYEETVYFNGRLWMFGGLAYQSRTFLNDIWSSADGVTWAKLGTAAWSARGGHTVLVYHDRLWLFGGANHIDKDRSTDGFLNDVWVSDDGISWTPVTQTAPWSARDNPGVVVFNDELYLLGGQNAADVWRSPNGRDWSRVAAEANWGPRHDAARVVLGGKLWVFGGWIDRSTNAVNDVWYSSDGLSWQRQTEHAPWAPRGPVTVVFQDKIWIYSGKHTGADDNWGGDLWQMSLPDFS